MMPAPRITAAIPTPSWRALTRRRRRSAPAAACSVLASGVWASVNGTLCRSSGSISSLGRGHDLGALAGEDGGGGAPTDPPGPADAVGGRGADESADEGARGGANDEGELGDRETAAHDGAA